MSFLGEMNKVLETKFAYSETQPLDVRHKTSCALINSHQEPTH